MANSIIDSSRTDRSAVKAADLRFSDQVFSFGLKKRFIQLESEPTGG